MLQVPIFRVSHRDEKGGYFPWQTRSWRRSPPRRRPRSRPIDPGVRIGHVHLKVADIERSLAFYCGVLGFELQARYGTQAAFFSAGGYHHHFGINTWESKGGPPPAPGTTGLYHTAILYPTRAALADALRRLIAAGVPLDGASDHGVSEALYLRDPTRTASSSIGTGRRSNGRRTPTARSP